MNDIVIFSFIIFLSLQIELSFMKSVTRATSQREQLGKGLNSLKTH